MSNSKVDIKENEIKQMDTELLSVLLRDKSSGRNILWATDNYAAKGEAYASYNPITVKLISGKFGKIIRPRIDKSKKEQQHRIKAKAEVFTPSWICNKQNNCCDADWFGRDGVFNTETDESWQTNPQKITFPQGKTWQDYVCLRVLEITCGEAPYLASRYDTTTGKWIEVSDRIGVLDRKIRVVTENTTTEPEWYQWVLEAYKSTYGYEWQGDSLLIARENLLYTFIDHYVARWENFPIKEYLFEVAQILTWNIWQMDGLKYVVPDSCKPVPNLQMSLFDDEQQYEPCPGCVMGNNAWHTGVYCKVMNWQKKKAIKFTELKGAKAMKFDYVIGNPPYQDNSVGEQKNNTPPIYHYFLDEAFKLSNKVTLIHPARFLFDAGDTPKAWNRKMLADTHFKVLWYEQVSSKVFANTDIKGGVAVTYHDSTREFQPIEIYSVYPEINSIKEKVLNLNFVTFKDIVFTRTAYRLTQKMHEDHPEALSQLSEGHAFDMSTNIFARLPQIFFDEKPDDNNEYVQIYGLANADRAYKYIRRDYVKPFKNLDYYKVFVPKSNGSGAIGEVLSTPLIGLPLIGHTETFISIGAFETEFEANACLKYVKSKFARTLLGVLKITQDNPPEKWRFVPMQNFTPDSDIDWSLSVAGVDAQLYKKYGLTQEEIKFIETHVKEME